MRDAYLTTRVFITVMTYPQPSRRHEEVVCTAGITEKGEWVRLYPISYRFQPRHQQFRKYQWIEIDLAEHGSRNDPRKESRTPLMESIKILGEPIKTWDERRKIIDKLPRNTVNQLTDLYKNDGTSLGIICPKKIIDFTVEPVDRYLKPEHQMIYDQMRLFGNAPQKLRKIPYKFSYKYICEDDEKVHSAMIEDWELGVLFLNETSRLGSEEKAIESVRHNFYTGPCSLKKDLHFFVGTTLPYNSWVVLGLYYPPKIYQTGLQF